MFKGGLTEICINLSNICEFLIGPSSHQDVADGYGCGLMFVFQFNNLLFLVMFHLCFVEFAGVQGRQVAWIDLGLLTSPHLFQMLLTKVAIDDAAS